MGYFKRPVRRGAARLDRRAFVEPARELLAADWRECDFSLLPETDTFLRFVIDRPRVGKVGLFRSYYVVQNLDDLPAPAHSALRAAFHWFDTNIAIPRRLPKNAVCWFRADATECIDRMRTLIEIYRLAGHPVLMQATRNPGRVVYQDERQIAAVGYPDQRSTSSVV